MVFLYCLLMYLSMKSNELNRTNDYVLRSGSVKTFRIALRRILLPHSVLRCSMYFSAFLGVVK